MKRVFAKYIFPYHIYVKDSGRIKEMAITITKIFHLPILYNNTNIKKRFIIVYDCSPLFFHLFIFFRKGHYYTILVKVLFWLTEVSFFKGLIEHVQEVIHVKQSTQLAVDKVKLLNSMSNVSQKISFCIDWHITINS